MVLFFFKSGNVIFLLLRKLEELIKKNCELEIMSINSNARCRNGRVTYIKKVITLGSLRSLSLGLRLRLGVPRQALVGMSPLRIFLVPRLTTFFSQRKTLFFIVPILFPFSYSTFGSLELGCPINMVATSHMQLFKLK
jgi:hypothetical protein